MFRLVNPILDSQRSASVESEHITLTQNTVVHVYNDSTLQNLKVHKNSTEYASGTTFSAVVGDELWITGIASNLYNTATFANLLLERVGFMSLAVVTALDPATLVIGPAYINKPPGDYLNGYTPTDARNQLVRVYAASDSTTITDIVERAEPVAGTIGDGQSYVFVADYVGDKVHKINPTTGVVVQSIDVNKPFGLGYTPTESTAESVVAYTLVTSPVDSLVHIYNGVTHELIESVGTGTGPYGVCGEPSGADGDYSFWVACFTANRVEHWYYANGTALVKDFSYELPAGSGPYDIKVDATGNAYVSCLISDKVARCPAGGGGVVEYANVGIDPWGLCIKGEYVYAACAGSNSIYAVHTASLTVTEMPSLNGVSFVEIANIATVSAVANEVSIPGTASDTLDKFDAFAAADDTRNYYFAVAAAQTMTLSLFVYDKTHQTCFVALYDANDTLLGNCTVTIAADPRRVEFSTALQPGQYRIRVFSPVYYGGKPCSFSLTLTSTGVSVPSGVVTYSPKLYAGSFSSGEFKSYTLDTPTTMTLLHDIPESERLFEGLIKSADDTLVFAVNMHNDAPDRTAFPDNTPDHFTLNPLVGLHTNTQVESNILTISGLLTTSRVVLPSLSSSPIIPVIEKNEGAVGVSTLIVNNDTINLKVLTPGDQTLVPKMHIPLVYEGGVAMWVLSMLPRMAKVRVGGWIQGG